MQQRVAVVVEDDEDIRELMSALLSQSGFEVHAASTGTDGVQAVQRHEPDLVTVDLGLPDIDGYEVTRRVRGFTDAYVVMISARSEEIDTLLGLDAGADDYLIKPFRPREVRARVEALMRRPRASTLDRGTSSTPPLPQETTTTPGGSDSQAPAPAGPAEQSTAPSPALDRTPDQTPDQTSGEAPAQAPGPAGGAGPSSGPVDGVSHEQLELAGLTLYPRLYQVMVLGREVNVTPTEFLLLETLLRSGRVVRTKAELFRVLRGEDPQLPTFVSSADERTVEVHLGNLRRKLGDDSRTPRWIQTVRGVGYRAAGPVQSVR